MDKTYSVSEVAKILGYSKNSIYSFLKDGVIRSVRVGKGKFRIPQSEVDRFLGSSPETQGLLTPVEKQENKKMVEQMVAQSKEEAQPTAPPTAKLPAPRPGKSLEELSGEAPMYNLKLWFEKRVGIPRLFDWFISLSSIILGISLFLHSKQIDVLAVGRYEIWFTPVRISLIFSGIGLIVADMIQEEFIRYRNLSSYFRAILFVTYLGFAWLLFLGKDIDGFAIYGLFALTILAEAVLTVRSSTPYMFFIQGLLIATALIFYFYPSDPAVSQIASGLSSIFDGFKWIWPLIVTSLIMFTLYGFFWDKKVLKGFSAFCGVLLTFLALFFANNNYWERAFFILIAGMTGMILPFWETFKLKFKDDRPLPFRMFGTVVMFFFLVVVLIAIVQSILLQNADHSLSVKADFGRVMVEEAVNGSYSALESVVQNPLFLTALKEGEFETVDVFAQAALTTNPNFEMAVIMDEAGEVVSVKPFLADVIEHNYGDEAFFKDISAGNRYFSRSVEPLAGVSQTAIFVGTPIKDKGEVIGAIVASLNLKSLDGKMGMMATDSEERVALIDGDGRWISSPEPVAVGQKIAESDTTNLMWSRTTSAEVGYDGLGKYSLFRASKSRDLSWTVVVSQPVFNILNVSRSGLVIVLFLLSVAVITVYFSFVFSKRKAS